MFISRYNVFHALAFGINPRSENGSDGQQRAGFYAGVCKRGRPLTARVAGQTLALVGGGVVWEERVLLVIAVNGTGGYDVILVLAH